MIAILANVVEVIVFPTGTNTLLRIHGALQMSKVALWVHCSEKYALELASRG